MRPGRLPEDHPLEQQARDELRKKQGTKPDPATDYSDRDLARWTTDPPPQPTRWGS